MINLASVRPMDLWYVVGYIATDGCLSKDGRHIDITSKDFQVLEAMRKALAVTSHVTKKHNSTGKVFNHLQFSDVGFYRFLLSLNLTPKKSLTLGPLKIPEEYFSDFLRGVIDGDGSISSWKHSENSRLQWSLRIVSASKKFIRWLQQKVESTYHVLGKAYVYPPQRNRNELHLLKFGKIAAKIIMKKCYYGSSLYLERKFQQAIACLESENGWQQYRSMKCPGAEIGIQSGLKIQ